ncbi:A-kinase anchor protein SPHKAP [Trichomycterus rosablanca]|uniref:A-kinase anchor protein SPHKAP n=1 Tax=Trichomycterus rosablanca TaxID=2290929 RepID=UPI002F3521B2
MEGAQRLLHAPGNFQPAALLEDLVETEGFKTETGIRGSVSAYKKVLCSNSVLDSSDYWLKNDKTLCRVRFLEDQHDGGCTINFVNLDTNADHHDDSCFQKLASVSPDLPRLVESLVSRRLKEHEVLLLNGLESPDTCSHDPVHSQNQRADVCVVQNGSKCDQVQSDSLILQINKFLIGLQSGQEKQRHVRLAGHHITDDDTNRSVSSIEEDFLTASEHLGEESEDDKNDSEGGLTLEAVGMLKMAPQHRTIVEREDSEDSDTICASSRFQKVSRTSSTRGGSVSLHNERQQKKESKYASNLAESVLQDAFIHLSHDESSFSTEPARRVSSSAQTLSEKHQRSRTHSFELPKIVIVQSPDNCEEAAEWPGTQSSENQDVRQSDTQAHSYHSSPIMHKAKPVEVALAYAASVIGTISSPQVTERLALNTEDDHDGRDADKYEDCTEADQGDYTLPSALCGMSKVAGAVNQSGDSGETKDPGETFTTSMGLLSAAQASTAVTLQSNLVEGTSIDTFRSIVAESLLGEALEVLNKKQSYTCLLNVLETTQNKIVDGIMHPRRLSQEGLGVDDFTQEVAESVFKYALEKSVKKKELKGKDAPDIQNFLTESVNSLLFDVLFAVSRKISDISNCSPEPFNSSETEVCATENEATTMPGEKEICQPNHLSQLSQIENSEKKNATEKQSFIDGKKENQRSLQDKESCLNDTGKHAQSKTNKTIVKESEPQQQFLFSSTGCTMEQSELKTSVNCFAEDLASTVVSMATELAAICLENSSSKQPWFCALKAGSEGPEGLLVPCRSSAAAALRRKETHNGVVKKHRPPRLSEIKRKTEEQPELMERLVNRVVDETVNLDEPVTSDFALFALEVTNKIMNCPELNVTDTSKSGQTSRSRLQCERWGSRGKASSCESIPEEDADPSGAPNSLDPGSRLGHNLSRGSSISKQSSCESITDEFSCFMVNQMETEGRGFDLLLDYYAGKNASNILAAAIQQATSKKNGHLSIRTSTCLSKQSSTESITEEFYRFMLRDIDKENKDFGMTKTKEWSNNLLPPPSRALFCIRQSSVPDRRSSDSRLTVNSPIKANSFDGFARNVHGDSLNIFSSNSVSSTGLCKSDSCLYKRGRTDHITDMLIHETWANSIESLMRKNKIIANPTDDITELDAESQPHVQLFANRLAADIVESGKSLLGSQPDVSSAVGERRRGFKQSRLGSNRGRTQQEMVRPTQREVPLIHIEPDKRDERCEDVESEGCFIRESNTQVKPQSSLERVMSIQNRDNQYRTGTAPSAGEEGERCSFSSSSEESGSGWAQVPPDEETQEETTSSFIQLSEGNGNSSASSLGVTDLEGFPESSTAISTAQIRKTLHTAEQTDEVTSGLSTAGSSCHRELQVMNFDLEFEDADRELMAALQWIAASELSVPALNYRTTQQNTHTKFQKVVQLALQRSWCIGEFISLVLQFCRLSPDSGETLSLFDWLLQTQR